MSSNPCRVAKKRVCNTCSREFTRTEHLERHERSHTNEKPFSCTLCGHCYSRRDTLLRHQRQHTEPAHMSTESNQSTPSALNETSAALSDQSMESEHLPGNRHPNLSPPTESAVADTTSIAMASLTPRRTPDCYDTTMLNTASASNLNLGWNASSVMDSVAPYEDGGMLASTTQSSGTQWNFGVDDGYGNWIINSSFDFGSLDSPFAVTMAELGPGFPELHPTKAPTPQRVAANVKHLWFTNIEGHSQLTSGSATPIPRETCAEVDDEYRQALQRKLQVSISDHSLPSSDFLNLCVKGYFARFHLVFPVVHAPTFRPSQANSMLLLSICSVGSLFTGSVNAALQGAKIFERLNKAILATWERLIARDAEEVVPMVQAALIGQTFGLLSGEPRHLATVDAFHGTVISWARRKKMFGRHEDLVAEINEPNRDLDSKWRLWAKREEMIRVALGLYIHDAELANIFYHEPCLRRIGKNATTASSNWVYVARKPEDWFSRYKFEKNLHNADVRSRILAGDLSDHEVPSTTTLNCFTSYARLQSISSTILEDRLIDQLDLPRQQELIGQLILFHKGALASTSVNERDDLGTHILWHLCFISVFADLDLLQRVVGRDGPCVSAKEQAEVRKWATSVDAKRCIVHISLLQKRLETMSIGFEPGIHVPRAIFLVAIVWFCYTQHLDHDKLKECATDLHFQEIRMLGHNANMLLHEMNGGKHGGPTMIEANEILCRFIDLLQKIGHWEIARRFASIIRTLVHKDATVER